MSYRNIDENSRLLQMAERYWQESNLTKDHLYLVLKPEGFSEKEIDNAISDYYQIHLRSNIFFNCFIIPISIILLIIFLLYQVYVLII